LQFYLRDKELKQLKILTGENNRRAKFIMLTGSRKVGKTALVSKLINKKKGVYLTITPKATAMQLNDISDYLREVNPPDSFVPRFENWKHLFEYFFMLAKESSYTVVLDEFHHLENVEASALQELRTVWDRHSKSSYLNIIFVTFNIEFVNRMFHHQDALFYKLPDYSLKLIPFSLIDVIALFKAKKSKATLDQIVDLYIVFGGYPKYYHLFDIFDLWNKSLDEILKTLVFQPYAPLGNELKDIIVNLFTRENKIYISILQSMAHDNHSLTQIANNINVKATTIAKYLSELENKKNIIKRKQPINFSSKERSKFGRYYISSYFENFWFRFVQPDFISYEMKQYDRMLLNIEQNFPEYRKQRLPLLIKELMQHADEIPRLKKLFPHDISTIGSIWNRKHYVDIIAFNDDMKEVLLGNVYTGNGNLQLPQIQSLIENLQQFDKELTDYKIHRVLFHNSKINLDAGKFSEERNTQLCTYGKVLKEIYEDN